MKIAVNRISPQGIDAKGPGGASASAYVTFAHKEDASAAIHAVDNFMWDGRVIRYDLVVVLASVQALPFR